MSNDDISRLDLPYRNLIVAGFIGVGKTTVGQALADALEIEMVDVDAEIMAREDMTIRQIRQEFGDARLRVLEADVCREASFKRQVIIVVGGGAMLDERNANRLASTGHAVCLTCEMGEALRRLHMAYQDAFRDPNTRRHLISRLRREYGIVDDNRYVQLDTTHLNVQQVVDELIHFWQNNALLTPQLARAPSHQIQEANAYLKPTRVSRPHHIQPG